MFFLENKSCQARVCLIFFVSFVIKNDVFFKNGVIEIAFKVNAKIKIIFNNKRRSPHTYQIFNCNDYYYWNIIFCRRQPKIFIEGDRERKIDFLCVTRGYSHDNCVAAVGCLLSCFCRL